MEYQNENFNGEYDFKSRFHNGWYIKDNLHEYSEFIWCVRGEGIVTVNGKRIPLGAGQLVWIPPNYIHGYDLESADVVCAVFSNDFIPLFFETLRGRYFYPSAIRLGELSGILDSFYELKADEPLRISGYLNLILAHVLERSELGETRHTDGIFFCCHDHIRPGSFCIVDKVDHFLLTVSVMVRITAFQHEFSPQLFEKTFKTGRICDRGNGSDFLSLQR